MRRALDEADNKRGTRPRERIKSLVSDMLGKSGQLFLRNVSYTP